MKTKRLIAIILMLLLALSFVACGSDSGGKDITSEETTSESDASDSTEADTSDSDESDESDSAEADTLVEMGELSILIDGETVTLPITVEELTALGWTPSNEEQIEKLEKTLEVRECTRVIFQKGNNGVISFVANLSDDRAITASQGTIFGFENITTDSLEFPNGIVKFVSTREDVIAAYGESEPSPTENHMFFPWEGFRLGVFFDDDDIFVSCSVGYLGSKAFDLV